jgi:hypothetical protein
MRTRLLSALRSFVVAFAFVAFALVFGDARPAAAATGAGTAITNTATATYSDGTNSYTTQSNTVTTTVQNAPSLTIAPPQSTPGANTVSPGGTITDMYTLTNTGNGSGYFQLTGTQNTNDGVTAGQGTFTTYVVNVPGQSQQTFTTIAAVNTYLSTGNTGSTPFSVTSGSTITIGVQYAANSGATGTITTNLTATITQPAVSGAAAATSSSAVGQYNDNVVADARMDVQKLATVGGTASAPTVTYTVRYNNGGSRAMVPVYSNALPAGTNSCAANTSCGILVTDKLPSYNATQLTLSGTPSFVTQPTGATFVYYNGTTWSTSSTGATTIGVFIPASAITGTFGASNPGSSSNSVTAGQAQLSFTFTINGSTATGAANSSAITNVANSIYADQSGFIEGPGITYQSVPNGTSATTSQTAPAIANTNGTLTGSGQITSAASPASAAVLNGPNGYPAAVGQTNNDDDYTAISYTAGGTAAASGGTETVPASAAAVTFTNSVQNNGNKDDTFALTSGTLATDLSGSALPTGWTVTFQSTGQTASGTCPAVTAGTTITSICVTSGSTATYKVVMTPPASATTFTPYVPNGVAITATSGNDNTKTNATNDEFFVGGFVKLTKTVADASGQPCATASTFTANATTVNPGDCVQYAVTYKNVAPSGGTNDLTLTASTIVLTEDGTASGTTDGVAYANNWAANSNGLYAAPVDSAGGTLGGYSGGTAAGSTKFTDTISSLAAGASGTVTFKVQIK